MSPSNTPGPDVSKDVAKAPQMNYPNSDSLKQYIIEGTIYGFDVDDELPPKYDERPKPGPLKTFKNVVVTYTGQQRSVKTISNNEGFFQLKLTSEDLGGQLTISLSLSKGEGTGSGYKGEIKDLKLPPEGGTVKTDGRVHYWLKD